MQGDQIIFLSHLMHKLKRGIKLPQNVVFFCYFKVTAQSKNHPLGENSPNLVTLDLGMKLFKAFCC
jgi:hypothetical protein